MSNGLDAGELLVTAREELLRKVLPALPDGLRYEALMISNAMAIAKREIDDAQYSERCELLALGALLGKLAVPAVASGGGEAQALHELRTMLRLAIRGGAFDTPSQQETLIASLTQVTRHKLAISNPKVVADA